jgi:hypothetical protein
VALMEGALGQVPEDVRRTLRSYLADVTKVFGPEVEAVILYGSAARGDYLPGRSNVNLLILLKRQDGALLREYAKVHRRWKDEGIVVPLFLTGAELQASADVFPLEYLDIKEQHVLLAGRDPFAEVKVDARTQRLQCEQELRGNLLRLRQRFVEGGGEPEAVVILLSLSLTALLPCLRGLLRLTGRPMPTSSEELLRSLQSDLAVDAVAFLEALSLKRGLISPGPLEIPRLFERYLAGLQSLIERVARLKAEGRL